MAQARREGEALLEQYQGPGGAGGPGVREAARQEGYRQAMPMG
ncbi:MAG: hypothetical protein V8R55_14070 [Dysosmobacter sp.]